MKNSLKSKVAILVAAMLFSVGLSYAQVNKQKHIISSKILGEDRVISVHVPHNYENSDQDYPVIYLLDGKSHFQHAIGAVGFLTNQGQIPQSIVVAVHNVDRSRDFSPVATEKIPTSGGADKFLNFMSDELATFIDNNYRASEFSVLVGHSFGGTFAVHALLTKPEVFDGYVAISPYLHYADSYLIKEAANELKSKYKGQKYFYMTVGDEPKYFEPLEKFAKLVKTKSNDAISFNYNKMMDENHASIPYISLYKGVQHAFAEWNLSKETFMAGLESIDKHYAHVSKVYGSKVVTPEFVINKLGYHYIWEKEIDKAITVFTENTKRYPKSANVYDSLGEAFENNNQIDLAAENYKKAFEIGKKLEDKNLMVYKKNYKRVSEKLTQLMK